MERIQLRHPEGKKAPTMDKTKYDTLRASFLACLKKQQNAPFDALLAAVDTNLKQTGRSIDGKLEWNLFWVSLDLEANGEIVRNKSVSPMRYTLS